MIYTTEKMGSWLARMVIPVKFTQAQGWQIYWQQSLSRNTDFNKSIGDFIQHKNPNFKNERNHIIKPKLYTKHIKTAAHKKQEIKFAKGVSIIK